MIFTDVNFVEWRQHNSPKELVSNHFKDQKLTYVHNNQVESGLVREPHVDIFRGDRLLRNKRFAESGISLNK